MSSITSVKLLILKTMPLCATGTTTSSYTLLSQYQWHEFLILVLPVLCSTDHDSTFLGSTPAWARPTLFDITEPTSFYLTNSYNRPL